MIIDLVEAETTCFSSMVIRTPLRALHSPSLTYLSTLILRLKPMFSCRESATKQNVILITLGGLGVGTSKE